MGTLRSGQARTGLPVNISVTRKAVAMPDGNTSGQRPNLVAGQSIYPADQTIDDWLNIAAFSVPANGTWGNLGRFIARGPGTYEIDTSLEKKFHLTEHSVFDLRATAFNLLNHPQYGQPASNISKAATFGTDHQHHQRRSDRLGRAPPRRVYVASRVLKAPAVKNTLLALLALAVAWPTGAQEKLAAALGYVETGRVALSTTSEKLDIRPRP